MPGTTSNPKRRNLSWRTRLTDSIDFVPLFAGLIDRALNQWGQAPSLDGGNGDDEDADTETDTAIPDDEDDRDIASLASQPSSSLQPSSFQSPVLTSQMQQLALSLMFPGDLELDALFEDHGGVPRGH